MSIYKQYNPGSTSDLYLKLKDKDKVKLRIYSQPAISVYQEGAKPRYSWVIFNHDAGKPQVYTSGISVYRQIAALEEDWGDPTEFDIKIARSGSEIFDTEYAVTPVKDSTALTVEQEAEADKIDLLQSTKGKWLADYAEDGVLPEPVATGTAPPPTAKSEQESQDGEEPISLDDLPDDMPAEFLK